MRLGTIFTLLVFGAAGVWGYMWWTKPEPPPSYKTGQVKRSDIQESVTATGTLSALTTVVVSSQISGIVKSVHVDFNDVVKKDQVLAELDASSLEAQKQQAKATLATAQAQYSRAKVRVEDAERQVKRADELAAKDLISKAEREGAQSAFSSAKADLDSAAAQISEAQAALKLADLSLTRTKILSPIDGVIINRRVDPGQTVAASLSAPELFTIAQDLKKMRVIAEVDEADVGKLKEQMEAIFNVDAFPGEDFKGKIIQIRYSPSVAGGVVTYAAVIEVDNQDLKLRPGMTANVDIVSQKKENVLLVPNAALRFIPPENALKEKETPPKDGERKEPKPGTSRGKVYVQEGDKLRPVQVILGISDDKYSELLEGELKENDVLVTEVKKSSKSSGGAKLPGARF